MTFTEENFESLNSEELWESVKSQIFQAFSVWDIIMSKIQTQEPDEPLERLDRLFREIEYILEMIQVEISTSCTIATKEDSAQGEKFIVPEKNLCKFLEIPQLSSRIYLATKESNSDLHFQPVKNEPFETLKIEPEEWDVDFTSDLPHQEEHCDDKDLKETQPLSFWKNGVLQVHKTKYNPKFPISKAEFDQMKAGEIPKQCPNCNFKGKQIKDLVMHFFAELEGLDVSGIKEADEAEPAQAPKRSWVSKIKYNRTFPVSAAQFKQMKLSNIPKQCPNCNYKAKRIKDLVVHFYSKCEIKETIEKVPEYSSEYQPTFPVSEIEFERMKAGEIPKQCPKCNNYQTLRLKDLVRHFNSIRDCSSFVQIKSSNMVIKVKDEATGIEKFRCAFPDCPDADQTWSCSKNVVRHWETKHAEDTEKQVICEYCPQRFLATTTKTDHIRRSHPEMLGIKFCCSLCGKMCKSGPALRWHIKSHEKYPEKHIKAETKAWGKTEETDNKSTYEYQPTFPVSQVEFEQMKDGKIPRQCPKCNKYSTLKMTELVRHFNSVRDCSTHVWINSDLYTRVKDDANPVRTKYYKCAIPKCPDTTLYNSTISVARHLERSHCDVIELPIVCDFCPQRFLCNPTKREHTRCRHSEIVGKKGQCSKCGKEFKNAYCLRIHEKRHSLVKIKPFKCEFCDKKFPSNGTKLAHMRIHHRDECVLMGIKVRLYHCEHCGQEFKTKGHVNQHIASWHTDGQNPKYKCPICSRQLKQENSFDKHMANSHGVGERCKICNKLYKNRDALEKHMKAVHDIC